MKLRFWAALGAQIGLFASLNFFDDWTLELMPLRFVFASILCGLAYLMVASEFDTSTPGASAIFWLVTIGLRLIALPLTPASDVWRYQVDGALQHASANPYQTAPQDSSMARELPDLSRVPRSTDATAYSPGAEILFRIIPASAGAFGFKLVFGVADLLTVVLLLRLVNLGTAAWFAWNPLVAYSFFGAGHFDSMILLAIVATLVCLTHFERSASSKSRWTWAFAAAVALGVGISLRPVMLVLVLPAAIALRGQRIALSAATLPLIASGAVYGIKRIGNWNFFGDFPQVSRLNDLFWWLIEDTVWPNWHQQHYRYDVVIVCVCLAIACFFVHNWRRGFLWSLGAAIILAPILHAWYVTWILPVATWRRAFAWHFLSVTVFAYYLFFSERLFALPWRAEPWMRGMIILPVIFAIVLLTRQKSWRSAG